MRFIIMSCLFLMIVCAAMPVHASQPPVQRVARGDAFVFAVQCPRESKYATVSWRNRQHRLAIAEDGSGYAVGQLLLGVPVDGKDADTLLLGLQCQNQKQSTQRISLYEKDRLVQKLTVAKKYVSPPKSVQARIKRDREKVRAVLAAFSPQRHWQLPLLRPVPGDISSLYGVKRVFNGEPRSVHKGLDLRGASGTPIHAVADGTVVLVDDLYFAGNVVYVDHGLGVISASIHMSQPLVQPGQFVRRGDTLGLVGATGRVTGPHLHMSIFVQGVPVDPLPLLGAAQQ